MVILQSRCSAYSLQRRTSINLVGRSCVMIKINPVHMARAVQNARHSNFERYTLGSVLVHKNKIISDGWNMDKTHPILLLTGQRALHAEICAVVRCSATNNFEGMHMYVARVTKTGTIAKARPCTECRRYLKKLGLAHVHYTIDPTNIGTLVFK